MRLLPLLFIGFALRGPLGLVVPEMTNYGFASVARELETLCREAGLQLLIACSDENPSQEMMAVNSLLQRQVDGLIIASSSVSDAEYQKINQRLPVVLLDRRIGVFQAVLTSWMVVLANPVPMAFWAALMLALTLLGLGTVFFAFIVAIPVLGHASWHAYRDLVDASGLPERGENVA